MSEEEYGDSENNAMDSLKKRTKNFDSYFHEIFLQWTLMELNLKMNDEI